MKKTTAILFFLPMLAAAFAQRADRVTAWIDVQQTDGKVVISAWCQNHTPSPLHLHYKAVLFDKDTVVQEGRTLALPDQPNLLLNGNFLIEDGQFEKVQLLVYQRDEIVATAQAIGPSQTLPGNALLDALQSQNAEAPGFDDHEIGRLVLDETRSKLAHDFYELFYNTWTSVEEDVKINYTINIREQPNVIGIGSRIVVEVDGQELLQLNLQPRAEVVESLATQLVESLYNHFTNPDDAAKELQTEDISGTGVY